MEVKILTHLCRICLSDNILLPIFDTNSNEQICDKIMACAAVHVALGDPLPNQICKQCHRALEISHLFKTKCEQTDRKLRAIIKDQTALLSQSNNTPIKYQSVQINIEPSNIPIFNDLDDNISLSPKMQTSDVIIQPNQKIPSKNAIKYESKKSPVIFNNELLQNTNENFSTNFTEIPENISRDILSLNGEVNPIYTFSNLSKNLITVSSTDSIDQCSKNCGEELTIETEIPNEFNSTNQPESLLENEIPKYKQEIHNDKEAEESQNSFLSESSNIEECADEKKVQQSNGDIIMYFDNDDFHLGEECEVITDEVTEQASPNPETPPPEDIPPIDMVKSQIVPKGRYVIIKSVIKPQNIHYVTMDSFRNKENSKLIPIKQVEIKKENAVEVKSEIPEPASYIETETFETEENFSDYVSEEPENTSQPNLENHIEISKEEIKYKGRGRPRKSDKYKPPQGVSYLKSGRKNVPVFVRTRKTKRTRYSYLKDSDSKKSDPNVYTKSLPIVKRARVEKIIPPKRFEEKKTEPNRKLSTNMLLSDKQFNKLNDPQKQVLYQRLKLQNFRPTSKKDICERGIPKPLYVVSPKLSEDSEGNEDDNPHIDDKKQRTTSISDDLAIIQSSNYKNQTIDQDLKLINGSSYSSTEFSPNQQPITESTEKTVESTTTPAKTGRHTAIKSKRPQKRNHLQTNYSDPQKIEIELKMVPRKSERQRSPKKIFPEIDIFASPKKKVIEIPVSEHSEENNRDYEIEKNEQNHNKFKIKIRRNSTKSTSDEENETNAIFSDYYQEIEVETENDEDYFDETQENSNKYQSTNSIVVRKILEKERVKLDYGAGLSCNVCNKSFPYRSHLIRHVRTHTGLKPFTCDYCKKSFTSLSSLNIHVKNHIGDHPYSCEVCGRGFVQPSVLKRHMLSHTGEHPFQCEICYKTFVHDSSLKTHLKMHTVKEPQHKCDICEKKFKYLSTLTSHLKTHSGIKPFTCPECRKAFYRRSLLTRHMRSHTKERPYKCKLCKARFAYSGGLASHKKLHTGIRPYECELCDFTFFRSSHLKNHMQKIHNNGVLLSCQRCNMNFDSKPLFKRHLSLHIKRDQTIDFNTDS